MRRRLAALLIGTVAALSAVSFAAAPAGAEQASEGGEAITASVPAGDTPVGMTVGAIDEDAASKAGNNVLLDGTDKVLIDGETGAELARIPADPEKAKQDALTPSNVVYGNCGLSYFWMTDIAGSQNYEFWTGFEVNGIAYDFSWFVNIRGEWDNGVYNFEWEDFGPILPRPAWTSGYVEDDTSAPSGTYHYGRVTSGTAWLLDGRVCFSGYPNDWTYVY